MGIFALTRTKKYRNFMAKLYGWGAAVVIIGALFKINHYAYADVMLIIGLGTESIIFFFSAFEPPHVEPDWSLVYPQLAGMYHEGDMDSGKALARGETVSQELDKMLEKAKIGPELIQSLGDGLRNLNDTTSKLSKVSDASLANEQYVTSLKSATESAHVLNDSYRKTSKVLETGVVASEEQLKHIQATSKSASTLSGIFNEVSESLKEDVTANKAFSASIANAASSTNKFIEKYQESTEILSKTAETLSHSAIEGGNYNKQLSRISSNLSALNALYELHLQGSNEQMENTNKFNTILGKFAENLTESVTNTAKYKENLNQLNKVVEMQLQASTQQAESSSQVHDSMVQFLQNLNASVQQTAKFKEEVDAMAKNIAALNKVYGNMLSAMNVSIK
jgi:gliding motility-associated protein GldL